MSQLIKEEEKLARGTLWEVRALLAQGVDVNTCSEDSQETALHKAAERGVTGNVSYLLRAGANVNARSSTGQTPLHYAARNGNLNIVWLLVACGAELDVQDDIGRSPLHLGFNRKDVVKALLQAGADRTLRNNSGATACDLAKMNPRDHSHIIDILE